MLRYRSLISCWLGVLFTIPLTSSLTFTKELPPDEDYVTVKNGHLYLNGQRIRFWGVAGTYPAKNEIKPSDDQATREKKIAFARERNRRMIQRMLDMGINLVRWWAAPDRNGRDEKGESIYQKGDGSNQDLYDEFVDLCYRNGIRVWYASFGNHTGDVTPEDVHILQEPATAKEWQESVKQLKDKNIRHCIARQWDRRMELLYIRELKKNADHFNQYRGLRCADDPVYIVWELTNEEWWMSRMTAGAWLKLPPYFRKSLIQQWHQFLKKKYTHEKNLIQAWGFLLPGENLDQGTILLAPLRGKNKPIQLNDANPQAEAAFKGVEQPVGREHFNRQRGSDVIEFFTQLLINHKQRVRDEVKKWGKSCRLSPMLFDTGIGCDAPSQYLHQLADAVAHDAYIHGTIEDKTSRRYPFFSWLEQYPRICYDVPWLEHNKIEGKPYFCYETQIGQPAKYRAEFPWMVTSLASIQDWDIICWHYYASLTPDYTKENPHAIALSFPGPGAYQFHFVMDEVQMSAMKAAAIAFCNFALQPAPNPTKFIYGRKTLYDPASMDYAGSYGREGLWNMLYTTYRYGCRILIDPTQEEDKIEGPVVRAIGWGLPNPVIPTSEITYDWKKGFLRFDSPKIAMFVGFLADYGSHVQFQQTPVLLKDVVIHNDPEIPYPVTNDEKFISFACVSQDNLPLNQAKRILISLVSTSQNSGLDVPNKKWGSLPARYARVGATIESPIFQGKRYIIRDWEMRILREGVCQHNQLSISASDPVFTVELLNIDQ